MLSENGEHGDSPLGGCPPPAAVRPGRLDGLGTEHSSEISEPSTSRSRLRGRRRKCDAERPSIATESGVERQSLPDDNTDSSTMEDPDHSWHRSRNFRGRRAVCGRDWYLSGDELDTPSEAETHDKSQEDCDRQPAAAAPKVPRRRGKQKKSRVKTAGAEAQREAGTSSSAGDLPDDADGSTERGEAAGLAARLESVRRQTLRDLRRPGVDGSPAPDPGHCSRRTVGTPEPELEQAPPADQDARDAEAPAGGVTKLTRRALLQESEPLTPRSRKRKRLTLYESDQESDEPPLELKIERHDSQTRTWPKEGASEVFPDGLKIKKRAKHATTPGKRRVKEESDVIHGDLDGEERQSEEMRGSVSPEGKIDMKENDHIVQEDRDGTRRKKKKCKRPRPELVSAAPVGDDDFGSPPALSPALTPSTRGRRKEVSYAELSEDDDAVFELMNQEHAPTARGRRSRGSRTSRREGGAADTSHASDSLPACPLREPAAPAPAAAAQLSPWRRPLALPLRTPPRQRFTRTRVQDIGLPLEDINALAVSPLTPSGRASGSGGQKVFTPPTALSLLQLTTSPIMAQVRPAKRVRRALHQ